MIQPAFLKWAMEGLDIGHKLYHYATTSYDVLKTRALSGEVTPMMIKQGQEDMAFRKMPGPYYEHISFFFEQPPIDKMSKIFGKVHPFWYPDHEIFEHVVSIDSLPAIKYLLTESPEVTAFFYDEKNDALSDEEYFNQVYAIRKKNKEIGSSIMSLRSVIQHLRGETVKNYLAMKDRPNFDEIKTKYAATVPHLMIYPSGGEIEVQTVNKITVK